MKILVTGGAGFVGSSLCIKLKEKYPDYCVAALDNLKRSGSEVDLKCFITDNTKIENEIEWSPAHNLEKVFQIYSFGLRITRTN